MARLNDIPEGLYCYKIESIDLETGKIKTKLCPNYQYLDEGNVSCLFLGNNEDYDYDVLLEDQCKVCGVNELEPEEVEV